MSTQTVSFKIDTTFPLLLFLRWPETAFALWILIGRML
jgi:hypothetical protein